MDRLPPATSRGAGPTRASADSTEEEFSLSRSGSV